MDGWCSQNFTLDISQIFLQKGHLPLLLIAVFRHTKRATSSLQHFVVPVARTSWSLLSNFFERSVTNFSMPVVLWDVIYVWVKKYNVLTKVDFLRYLCSFQHLELIHQNTFFSANLQPPMVPLLAIWLRLLTWLPPKKMVAQPPMVALKKDEIQTINWSHVGINRWHHHQTPSNLIFLYIASVLTWLPPKNGCATSYDSAPGNMVAFIKYACQIKCLHDILWFRSWQYGCIY